jgi:hypothetical protein
MWFQTDKGTVGDVVISPSRSLLAAAFRVKYWLSVASTLFF